jgi:hypothetical protein
VSSHIWITFFLILTAAGGVFLWDRIPRNKKRDRFKDRENLSPEQIFDMFYRETGCPRELVMDLWNEVADVLEIEPGKLRPTDRFDKELAAVEGWEFDDDLTALSAAAMHGCQTKGLEKDLSTIQTLEDYIYFFSSLERSERIAL